MTRLVYELVQLICGSILTQTCRHSVTARDAVEAEMLVEPRTPSLERTLHEAVLYAWNVSVVTPAAGAPVVTVMVSVLVVVPDVSAARVVVTVVVTVWEVAVALIHEHACETTELGKTARALAKALRRFTAAYPAGTVVKVYEPPFATAALESAIDVSGGYVVVVNEVTVASAVPVPDTVVSTVEVDPLMKDTQQSSAGSA